MVVEAGKSQMEWLLSGKGFILLQLLAEKVNRGSTYERKRGTKLSNG